jgi:hypothetical protein
MIRSIALPLILLTAGFAGASSITYTESTTDTGSLNGIAFSSAAITMTFTGDTANVTSPESQIFVNEIGTLIVNIASLGSATFTDATQAVANHGNDLAGFGDNTIDAFILGTEYPALAIYALATAIGPITNTPLINSGTGFATNEGQLILTSVGNSTFTATLLASSAPEPTTMILVGLGLLVVPALRRLR